MTSDKRLDAAPDIPTVDEAGAPGVYISTWYGLWVPKGTPQEAVDKLGAAARAAMADPAMRQRLHQPRPADPAAGAADRRGARGLHQGRDRQVASR